MNPQQVEQKEFRLYVEVALLRWIYDTQKLARFGLPFPQPENPTKFKSFRRSLFLEYISLWNLRYSTTLPQFIFFVRFYDNSSTR